MTDVGLGTRPGVFNFPAIERILYGQPAARALTAEAERLRADRVFLIVSGTMNRTTDEVTRVREALGRRYAGLYDRIAPHIPRESVLEAAHAARSAGADLIATFGGGSVTGAGKMVQLCLRHNITRAEGFAPFRVVVNPDGSQTVPEYDGPLVRQIAIPTTLSAGEFNPYGGYTDSGNKVKHAFRHPLLVPRVTIFDPAPSIHTPLHVWLSTGVSAISHATEGLCSPNANPASDAVFLHALRLLGQALPRIKRDPRDLQARLDCQFASWMSVAGRQGGVQMGATHAIGHSLGGTCAVPHGYTACVILPHVLRYNRPQNAERQRLVAQAMGPSSHDAADVIAALVADLELPGRLADVGVERGQFPLIAANTMHDSWIHTNPRPITQPEQVLEILEAAA